VVLGLARANRIQVLEESLPVKTLDDLIGQQVVSDRQLVLQRDLQAFDAEVAVDAVELSRLARRARFMRSENMAIEQRLDLHMPHHQLGRVVRCQVLEAPGHPPIDGIRLKAQRKAVEDEFQRKADRPLKEVAENDYWSEQVVIPTIPFAGKDPIYIGIDIGELIHRTSNRALTPYFGVIVR
jgi:hypothetical protein